MERAMGEGEEAIIPGLPNDLACLCLACVPWSQHGRLKRVCKAWRAAFDSKFLFDLRKKWGKWEEFLCIFRDDPSLTPGEMFDPRREVWRLIPPMPFDPHRYGLTNFVCVAVDTQLYVIGGSLFDARSFPLDRPLSSGAVFRYDPVRSQWERRSNMRNARGSFACGVYKNNSIVVAGGGSRHAQFSAGGSRISSVERYDVEKDRWYFEQELPNVRAGCVGFFLEDEFWVMGGYGASCTIGGVFPTDKYYRDGEILRVTSGKWRDLEPMWEVGERRRLGRVAVIEAKNGEPPIIFMLETPNLLRYDIVSNRWQRESCLPLKVLAEAACGLVPLDGELYVIPGSSLTDSGDVRRLRRKRPSLVLQIYHPKKRTWRLLSTKPPLRNLLSFPWAAMCSIRL
eukprot:Gb_39951 [translate_table: standard]